VREPRLNLLTVAVFYFGMFLLAVWIDVSAGVFRFVPAGPAFWGRNLRDLALALSAALGVVGLSYGGVRWVPSVRRLSRLLAEVVGSFTVTEAFAAAVFSALGEEFLFRGVLQHYIGIVPASIFFGILHTGPGKKFVPWTLFAVGVGLLLGYLYERTGNLLAPVATHFVVNWANLLLLSRFVPAEDAYGAGSS
jgi:membrane protease YdiL (CAAX protease family)